MARVVDRPRPAALLVACFAVIVGGLASLARAQLPPGAFVVSSWEASRTVPEGAENEFRYRIVIEPNEITSPSFFVSNDCGRVSPAQYTNAVLALQGNATAGMVAGTSPCTVAEVQGLRSIALALLDQPEYYMQRVSDAANSDPIVLVDSSAFTSSIANDATADMAITSFVSQDCSTGVAVFVALNGQIPSETVASRGGFCLEVTQDDCNGLARQVFVLPPSVGQFGCSEQCVTDCEQTGTTLSFITTSVISTTFG